MVFDDTIARLVAYCMHATNDLDTVGMEDLDYHSMRDRPEAVESGVLEESVQ